MENNFSSTSLPAWEDFPDLGLYMDQVTGYLTKRLEPFFGDEESFVTPTMINNYVKQKVIAAPRNKKYDRDQLSQLFIIFIMKKVFSIPEIVSLLEYLRTGRNGQETYELFYRVFEHVLTEPTLELNREDIVVASAALAVISKIYAERILKEKTVQTAEDEPQTEKKAKKSKKKEES